MNRKQLIAVWVGVVLVSLMILFPPWVFIHNTLDSSIVKSAGYSWISSPAWIATGGYGKPVQATNIDHSRLILQIVPVILIAGALIITFRDKKRKL